MANTYAPCPNCEAINRVPLGRATAETPVCGSCKTAIKSGKVKYQKRPGCDVEAESCLTCISTPDGDLVLDA